jgi:hypothetical protein
VKLSPWIKNITGQKFERLLVIEPTNLRDHREVVWKCKCDCGSIVYVRGGSLRSGHTKGCGCVSKDNLIAGNKKRSGPNHPDWKGGRKKNYYGYILVQNKSHPDADEKGYILEHRLVMEKKVGRRLKSNEIVHHINRNRVDNRPENLRLFNSVGEHFKHHRRGRTALSEAA